jgi:hypothetical protein
MKICYLEATDMGRDQQEIADRALEIIDDKDFKTPKEFWDIEGSLIEQACKDLGWKSTPQTGGLLVNWDSEDGLFHS